MAECDFKLAAGIAYNCDDPVKKGAKNTAWIMNFDDIDSVTYAQTSGASPKNIPTHVKSLTLKSNAKAYTCYIPGKTPFNGTQKALATGTYINTFTKTVGLVVLDNGADVSHNIIDQLANGRFVVVIENNYQGSKKDNTFEIYGLETGLAATEMTDEKYSEDTEGGWAVTLEESNAPTSGVFLLADADSSSNKTAIEVTREALASLVD